MHRKKKKQNAATEQQQVDIKHTASFRNVLATAASLRSKVGHGMNSRQASEYEWETSRLQSSLD